MKRSKEHEIASELGFLGNGVDRLSYTRLDWRRRLQRVNYVATLRRELAETEGRAESLAPLSLGEYERLMEELRRRWLRKSAGARAGLVEAILGCSTPVHLPSSEGRPSRLLLPPGFHLRDLAQFVFSEKTVQRVFEPVLADMQLKWRQAHEEGRPGKARWVQIRGYYHFLSAVVLQLPFSLLTRLLALWGAVR